jgi:cell division inhibitor SepF
MGLGEALRSVVDQFGGAHDDYDDYYEDDAFAAPEDYERDEAPRGVRGGDDFDAIYRDAPPGRSSSAERAARPLSIVRLPRLGFSLVTPHDFDDAQQIADHLRAGSLVIVDLRGCERDLSARLTDFCSGLTYALDAGLQPIDEQIVLLAPHNIELSSDALGGLRETGFFNQV